MKKLLFLGIIVAGVAYYYYFHGGGRGTSYQVVQRGGEQGLIATIGDTKADFTIVKPFEETYMLFGASGQGDDRSDALLSGIPLRTASWLRKSYPDFHRCNSPGAKVAQNSLVDVWVVTDKRDLRKRLETIEAEHDKRVRGNGERLCAKLSGRVITLNSLEKGGTVLAREELASMFPRSAPEELYMFVEGMETMDCITVL